MNKHIRLLALLLVFTSLVAGAARADSASSLPEFAAELEAHAAAADESFTIRCDPAVIALLKQSSSAGSDISYLDELLAAAGQGGSYQYAWLDDGIRFSDVGWYAGRRILALYENGRTDLLSSREKQTLDAALALTAGASGSDLEKERYIYDAICARITYDKEEDGTGEKDCAVGALLNGRADCDGYADAMALCCGLAGIPCRYIHGSGRKTDLPGSSDGSHMWNLVRIDGTWLMTDVTWGDHAETSYLYFNIGLQDAADSYLWCADTLLTEVAPAADFSRHLMPDQQPVAVRTLEDVYGAARSASAAGIRRLTLFCPDGPLWTDWENFRSMLAHGAMNDITYHDSGRLFEVTNASLPDVFCFCDTEEDMLSAINRYADGRVSDFTLYMAPALSRAMFADNHEPLRQLFSRSSIADPGMMIQYTENGGSVSLSGVTYTEPLPVCASADDLLTLIRRELPARPESLTFILDGSLSFDALSEQAAAAVYSLGVSSFSILISGNRVTFGDLAYYSSYCLASSESDIAAYLQDVRASGGAVRIYCTPDLYTALTADSASRFFALLDEAGFSATSFSYSDLYGLLVVE